MVYESDLVLWEGLARRDRREIESRMKVLLARRLAAQETGMETLPTECPWTLDRVLEAENAL